MSTTKYVDSAEVFGKSTDVGSSSSATVLPDRYDRAITVHEFMEDIRRRYAADFKEAKFVKLYVFSDLSVYEQSSESTYGFRTTKKTYLYVRPEMIAFTSLGPNKKVVNTVLDGGLEPFQSSGLYFETHIPQRKWDDSRKGYVGEAIKDADGNEVFRLTREIFKGVKVNCMLIFTM